MKKLTAIFLLMTMLLTALCGCGTAMDRGESSVTPGVTGTPGASGSEVPKESASPDVQVSISPELEEDMMPDVEDGIVTDSPETKADQEK